jgi:hypothetical protein
MGAMKNLNIEMDDETYARFLREKMRLSMENKKELTWDEVFRFIGESLK